MRRLDDLEITDENKEIVREWLLEWIEHEKEVADGRTGNVYKNDFENNEVFFFTECNDLIKDNVADNTYTDNRVRRRKSHVHLQVFLRYLLGEDINKTIECTHCGENNVLRFSFNGGSAKLCPDCGMLSPNLHPPKYYEEARSAINIAIGEL